MKHLKLYASTSLVVLFFLSTMAQASTISLSLNTAEPIHVGDDVSLDLKMDFTDNPTDGGAIDVFYDASLLELISYTPESLGDPAFAHIPDEQPGKLNGIAFGAFGGLSGPAKIGTLVFQALTTGITELTLAENTLFGGGTFNMVVFTGAQVTIQPSPVPLPGAVWLMLSGLGLIRIHYRNQKISS